MRLYWFCYDGRLDMYSWSAFSLGQECKYQSIIQAISQLMCLCTISVIANKNHSRDV